MVASQEKGQGAKRVFYAGAKRRAEKILNGSPYILGRKASLVPWGWGLNKIGCMCLGGNPHTSKSPVEKVKLAQGGRSPRVQNTNRGKGWVMRKMTRGHLTSYGEVIRWTKASSIRGKKGNRQGA